MHPTFVKAKSLLVMQHPFFAVLFLKLHIRPAEECPVPCPTTAIDGVNLYLNDEFLDTLSLELCVNVLVRNMMHIAFAHHLRAAELLEYQRPDDRDWMIHVWSVATDYAINLQMVDRDHLSLPTPYLYNEEWKDLNAEEIYEHLMANLNEIPTGNGMGIVLPFPGDSGPATQEERTKGKMDLHSSILQAAEAARQMGKVPGSMQDLVKKLTKSETDWRNELWEFASTARQTGYKWTKPHRRTMSSAYVLPSRGALGVSALNLILDTSGSMHTALLAKAFSEARAAVESYAIEDVIFLQCDTQITNIASTVHTNVAFDKVYGRGGTDMNPAFDYLRDRRPAPTILLSDMMIPAINRFPHPTLFCRVGGAGIIPPWGRVIDIKG